MAPADAAVAVADSEFRIELVQQSDYRFQARFDDPGIPVLLTDELKPLGGNAGPSPVRLLAVAVANRLAASLLFAMRKFKNDPGTLRAVATVSMVRNPQNRLRVGRIAVDVHLGSVGSVIAQLDRVLGQFEDFCVVTQACDSRFQSMCAYSTTAITCSTRPRWRAAAACGRRIKTATDSARSVRSTARSRCQARSF